MSTKSPTPPLQYYSILNVKNNWTITVVVFAFAVNISVLVRIKNDGESSKYIGALEELWTWQLIRYCNGYSHQLLESDEFRSLVESIKDKTNARLTALETSNYFTDGRWLPSQEIRVRVLEMSYYDYLHSARKQCCHLFAVSNDGRIK